MKRKKVKRPIQILSAQLGGRIIRLNLQRMRAATLVALVFQILNFIQTDFEKGMLIWIGATAVSVISLYALCASTAMLRQKQLNPRKSQLLYLGFWMGFSVAMIPYYMMDPIFWGMPVNVLLYLCFLIVGPVFSVSERNWIFGFHIFTLLLAWSNIQASRSYYLYAFVCVVAGYFLTSFVHENYITVTAKLESEAKIDFLTQVANRKYGYEQADALWDLCRRHERRFVAIAIDIDFFKAYNDTFGHYAGDDVLRKVAGAIKRSYGRASDIVCRTGGEEFLVCISVTEEKHALLLAKRMQESIISLKIPAGKKTVSPWVTVSVGVSVIIPRAKDTMIGILHEADHMLYRAKEEGRNCVVYENRLVTKQDY